MRRTARPAASATGATTGRPRTADLRYSGAVTGQGCYGQWRAWLSWRQTRPRRPHPIRRSI